MVKILVLLRASQKAVNCSRMIGKKKNNKIVILSVYSLVSQNRQSTKNKAEKLRRNTRSFTLFVLLYPTTGIGLIIALLNIKLA